MDKIITSSLDLKDLGLYAFLGQKRIMFIISKWGNCWELMIIIEACFYIKVNSQQSNGALNLFIKVWNSPSLHRIYLKTWKFDSKIKAPDYWVNYSEGVAVV